MANLERVLGRWTKASMAMGPHMTKAGTSSVIDSLADIPVLVEEVKRLRKAVNSTSSSDDVSNQR